MPVPRDVFESYPFLTSELPPGAGWAGNIRSLQQQQGFNRLEHERQDQVLTYYGQRARGRPRKIGAYRAGYPPVPFNGDDPYTGNSGWVTGSPGWMTLPRNRAYGKFVENALGESTQLGVLLAERKEAFGMIAKRVIGLRNSYKELRRGNFRQALKYLSVKPKRKHRSVVRTAAGEASGLWLEYWFGWAPTVNDLYSLGSVLAGPPPPQRYHAASAIRLPRRQVYFQHPAGDVRNTIEEGLYIHKIGATVDLINPDLQLLQQMGLVNPLSIAWEVVPFSFVVDWFTKFGGVIDATTDFVGCRLRDPYTTKFARTRKERGAWYAGDVSSISEYDYTCTKMIRLAHLERPVATLPRWLNYGTSKTRAATAASLLVQLFLDK